MVLSLGEPPDRFLLMLFIHFCSSYCCCSSFHFCSSFVVVLHFIPRLVCHVTGTPPWLLRFLKASTNCEIYPDYFWLPFAFVSTASATVFNGRFLPTGAFYLMLLHRHFWLNLPLWRPPWEPTVLPWSLQSVTLMILETQTQPISLLDLQ